MLTRMMMLVLQKRLEETKRKPNSRCRLSTKPRIRHANGCLPRTVSYGHFHVTCRYKAHTQLAPHVFGEAPHSTCIYFYLPRPHLQRLLSKACLSISRPSEVWSMDSRRWVWSLLLPCQQWIHEKNDLFCILLGSSFKKSYTSCVYTDISSKL